MSACSLRRDPGAPFRRWSVAPAALLLAGFAAAQVPDGWYVFGSFLGGAPTTTGPNGLFFAHPRDPQVAWVEVTGLSPALAFDPLGRRGSACVLRRPDGALIVGERSPQGTSVDLHILQLAGNHVVHAQLFSVGTSANVGEIPQCGLLPDGRIVVGATDLTAGSPLAQFQTLQFNWEGLGIVDPVSGGVTPIVVPNLNQFPGVINGLAVTPDGQTFYVGNWISASSGDLWSVPVAGGPATQVATLPSGASNVAIDLDGTVLVATLNGPPNLFRCDPVSTALTSIPTTTGPLNAIAVETVTGNYALATANAGTPPRSLVWSTAAGQTTVLQSPHLATISGIDVNPNPEAYGDGTARQARYDWKLRPNPGGLPTAGNTAFSVTLASDVPMTALSLLVLGLDRAAPGTVVAGLELLVNPAGAAVLLGTFQDEATFPMAIPGSNLVGLAVRGQTLLLEVVTNTLAASPGIELTIL